ncbi:DUF1735 domain-containing protein [Mucilaginibacter sp. AW1-7]|uniref:DUF1735 domain-containing protein n=1 Tax=Mucilaginibacter sp. AW1-7 TaxID=3349874 RepID=UPI003F737BF6
MKKLIILLGVLTVSLTSCLKDKPNVDFSNIGAFAELVHAGKAYFSSDAVTDDPDANGKITKTFQINITGQYAPTSDVNVVIAVDNSLIAAYNAYDNANVYQAIPANSYSLPVTTATIKAGTRLATFTVTFVKSNLDPSKSYMLPIVIKSASGVTLSANYNVKYYHFIGNDFAGAYTWNYSRWNDGIGVGSPNTNSTTSGAILPVSATEFAMKTGYVNGEAMYDVTFTRTVSGSVISYTNWTIKFNAANVAIYTDEGLTTSVAPHFILTPPATNADAKVFKVGHTTGASFPRFIIDTYTK